MTSDTYVGGVPNTPNNNEYPSDRLPEPEGKLGLSVGWGDQYEATDGGEGIPISSLPNGTYWLRGEVDPYHYLDRVEHLQQHHRHQAADRRRHREGARTDTPRTAAADRDAYEPGRGSDGLREQCR